MEDSSSIQKQSSSFVVNKTILEMILFSLKSHQLDDFTVADSEDQDKVTLKVYSDKNLSMLEAEFCTLPGIDLVIEK